MPQIPQPREFKRSTSPRSVLIGYGSNMALVLAALESYWESHGGGQKVEEVLLYNLWKECRKWLKKKEGKTVQNSELFMRRKLNVELLRDASMERLAAISPAVSAALASYQGRKQDSGLLGVGLKGLSQGYHREREFYLRNNKVGGSSISWSNTEMALRGFKNERNMAKFRDKQHHDLTVDEAVKISRLYPSEPVLFRNKIERMRNMATVNESGLIGDLDGNLILMNRKGFGQRYDVQMYAMDKYGNLFIDELGGRKDYVAYSARNGYELKQSAVLNHSSFMAGADVVCAGCLHIGYDTYHARVEAGALSYIDNNSGHYKPSAQNLQNCIAALRDEGVTIDYVMVSDRSQGPGRIDCYWAPDFIAGRRNRWADSDRPPLGTPAPPPVG